MLASLLRQSLKKTGSSIYQMRNKSYPIGRQFSQEEKAAKVLEEAKTLYQDTAFPPEETPSEAEEGTTRAATSKELLSSPIYLYDTSQIVPAFTINFRRGFQMEEYRRQTGLFLKAGISHYLAKIDRNIGPRLIEDLKYFYERPDVQCRFR